MDIKLFNNKVVSSSPFSHFVLRRTVSATRKLAEREGFEPSMEFNPHTPLAGERLQPLGHLSGHNQKSRAGKYTRLEEITKVEIHGFIGF
jgi:hypothetical protein